MRTLICSGLVFVLAVAPAHASGWVPGPPIEIDAGFNAWFNVRQAGAGVQLAPWYTYWPMEAHFQTPAPLGGHFPHWPPYLSERLNGAGGTRDNTQAVPPGDLNFRPPPPRLVPSGYYPYGYGQPYPTQGYWYGR